MLGIRRQIQAGKHATPVSETLQSQTNDPRRGHDLVVVALVAVATQRIDERKQRLTEQ
jgi:hypothetical protein